MDKSNGNAGTLTIGTCAFCGRPSGRNKYCSPECRQAYWDQKRNRVCEQCGQSFRPVGRSVGRFCSKECDNQSRAQTKRNCLWCGVAFQPYNRGATIYCSRECAYAYKAERKDDRAEFMRQARHSQAFKQSVCEECGHEIRSLHKRKYCDKCRRQRDLQSSTRGSVLSYIRKFPERRAPRECKECGELFEPVMGSWLRVFCSKECRDKADHRKSHAARRARIRAVAYEPIDPYEVFKSYGWKCAICGTKTPRVKRGTTADNAPELDHIIALALGGTHTRNNVQCACRRCNIEKGASSLGQLQLC